MKLRDISSHGKSESLRFQNASTRLCALPLRIDLTNVAAECNSALQHGINNSSHTSGFPQTNGPQRPRLKLRTKRSRVTSAVTIGADRRVREVGSGKRTHAHSLDRNKPRHGNRGEFANSPSQPPRPGLHFASSLQESWGWTSWQRRRQSAHRPHHRGCGVVRGRTVPENI